MQTNERLNWLLRRVTSTLEISEESAIEMGLRLVINRFEREMKPVEGNISFSQILSAANSRVEDVQGFTLDELLDDLYQDIPIFNPHKVKIQIGKVLITSGFKRKQVRRSKKDRPLWWFKLPMSNKE